MKIKPFVLGAVSTNSYIVYDYDGTNDAIMIDAPDDNLSAIDFLKENDLNLKYVLLTHGHFDHVLGLGNVINAFKSAEIFIAKEDEWLIKNKGEGNREILSEAFPYFLSIYEKDLSSLPSNYSFYEDEIASFKVIRTPGHTGGSVCLYDEKENVIFTGDTIFASSYGRVDLKCGNYNKILSSLKYVLSTTKDDAIILPGHGERSIIKREKAFYGLP